VPTPRTAYTIAANSQWLTEVTGTKIGTWPIYELLSSANPAYRRPTDRGAVLWRGQYVV